MLMEIESFDLQILFLEQVSMAHIMPQIVTSTKLMLKTFKLKLKTRWHRLRLNKTSYTGTPHWNP